MQLSDIAGHAGLRVIHCTAAASAPAQSGTVREEDSMKPLMSRVAAASLMAMVLAPAAPVLAAEAVLLASTAPGYTPGTAVEAGEKLSLPDGASVTLLFRSGQMLKLRGPAEATIEMPAPSRSEGLASAMAEAFRLRGVDASVIGATRALGVAPPRPQPQDVSVELQRSGTYCVSPADSVWLVRATTGPNELSLRRRGSERSLAWPAGAARIEWPSDVAIEDGDSFEVVAEGRALSMLTFRTVAGAAPSDPASIAEGVLLGCHEQNEAALRRLARSALPPELWLTTDRGRTPAYRPGDPITLTAIAGAEGWLYCVARRADGTASPVFPAGGDSARVPAAVPVSIPGPRRSAELHAGRAGTEQVRCWLADRDIGPELPHALHVPSGARLPDSLAADLEAVFGGMRGSRIARASLEIRVE
jgi:hypothetical protein